MRRPGRATPGLGNFGLAGTRANATAAGAVAADGAASNSKTDHATNPAGDHGNLNRTARPSGQKGTERADRHGQRRVLTSSTSKTIKRLEAAGHRAHDYPCNASDPDTSTLITARDADGHPPRAQEQIVLQHRREAVDSDRRGEGSQKLNTNRAESRAIKHQAGRLSTSGRAAPPAAQNKPIRPIIGAGLSHRQVWRG